MREGCWNCKKWEEHFYWNHLEESSFHFMKVMDGDFSLKMEFPLKFSKNFRVDLLDVISLKNSAGKSWDIGLWKEQDHFYFKGGWKQFIEANKIEQAYTLVFGYAGDSSFTVQIFDQNGCATVAPDSPIDSRVKQEEAVDQTLQNFQISHCAQVRNDDPMLCEISDDRSISGGRICEDAGLSNDRGVEPSRICKQEVDDLDSDSSSDMNTNHEDPQEITQLLQLKFAGKQSNCYFVKLISKSNLYNNPYMTIPTKFLSKYIPRKPYGITICNQKKKKWFVRCKWMSTSWGFFGKTLFNFIHENNFKEGDACVFKQKRHSQKVVMEMSIVLAKEVDSTLKNSFF